MDKTIVKKCAWCNKVYNESTHEWEMNEVLDYDNTVIFSHGICPDCLKKYYEENNMVKNDN